MQINKIELKQFRGFEALELEFPNQGSAVLIGINGAGKSSILDAIAILLNKFVEKISGIRSSQLQLQLSDIRDGEAQSDLFIQTTQPNNLKPLKWSVQRSFFKGRSRSDFAEINTYVDSFKHELKKNDQINIPIFNYYKVDRNAPNNQSKTKSRKEVVVQQMEAYIDAMGSALDYNTFINWFIEQNNIENQIIKEKQDFNAVNPNLEQIRNAINTFFQSVPDANYSKFRVGIKTSKAGQISAAQTILIQKGDLELEFKQLSDGERSILLLIADIAYRLTLANPSATNPLAGSGVVLIDEIEQHLHPAWQRAVVIGLESTFPNLQFIFSTHSPQVLSNIQRENIFILENFTLLERTPHTYGRDANSILYDIFAVSKRPAHAQKEFDRLYALMEMPNGLENARRELNRMTEKYGPHDTEIVRARTHLVFLESN